MSRRNKIKRAMHASAAPKVYWRVPSLHERRKRVEIYRSKHGRWWAMMCLIVGATFTIASVVALIAPASIKLVMLLIVFVASLVVWYLVGWQGIRDFFDVMSPLSRVTHSSSSRPVRGMRQHSHRAFRLAVPFIILFVAAGLVGPKLFASSRPQCPLVGLCVALADIQGGGAVDINYAVRHAFSQSEVRSVSSATTFQGASPRSIYLLHLNRVFAEDDVVGATSAAAHQGAGLVIWGGVPSIQPQGVIGDIRFEVLPPEVQHLCVCFWKGRIGDVPLDSELGPGANFPLTVRDTASEVVYVVLLTKGLLDYTAGDGNDATTNLSDAINQARSADLFDLHRNGANVTFNDLDIAYYYKGLTDLYLLHRPKDAIADFRGATNVEPDDSAAYTYLAVALTSSNHSRIGAVQGLNVLGSAIKYHKNQDMGAIIFTEGVAELDRGALKIAWNDFVDARGIDSYDTAASYDDQALIESIRHRYHDAVTFEQKAISSSNTNDPELATFRAHLQMYSKVDHDYTAHHPAKKKATSA